MNHELNYINYTSADFVNDEYFQNWVLGKKDKDAEVFWNRFLENHPEKKAEIEKAFRVLESIPFSELLSEELPPEEETREHLATLQAELGMGRQKKNKSVVVSMRRYWWAAAVLTGILIGSYFLFLNKNLAPADHNAIAQQIQKEDIQPGGDKAVLTLADGTRVILDSTGTGLVAMEGDVKVLQLKSGELTYNDSGSQTGQVQYNTVQTPRGGQYQVTLPDGTKVWMNSLSSLRFPTKFVGQNRKVEVSGEVYFEVAHNEAMPFIAGYKDIDVEVRGTHFNMNVYDDEPMAKVTLLEGSVYVKSGNNGAVIKPSQQAVIRGSNAPEVRSDVNLDEVMAWKNGLFYFDEADVKTVMRTLSKWYDVHVSYEGDVPDRKFAGEMQRNLTLSQVLSLLGQNQINYQINGKDLIIRP